MMKLWQFVSVFGGDTRPATAIASTKNQWITFGKWLELFFQLVEEQDRAKLDFELPSEFVRLNLMDSSLRFYISANNDVRSRRLYGEDQEIDAVTAFDRFGGSAI